jgi:hypothetical protein
VANTTKERPRSRTESSSTKPTPHEGLPRLEGSAPRVTWRLRPTVCETHVQYTRPAPRAGSHTQFRPTTGSPRTHTYTRTRNLQCSALPGRTTDTAPLPGCVLPPLPCPALPCPAVTLVCPPRPLPRPTPARSAPAWAGRPPPGSRRQSQPRPPSCTHAHPAPRDPSSVRLPSRTTQTLDYRLSNKSKASLTPPPR